VSDIFIYRRGQDQGPYSLEQVQASLIVGTLNESDFAWFEGLADWIPLSAAIVQLDHVGDDATDGWRRKVATVDQKAELRFLAFKVKRDLTQGACQDQIDEACKDPAVKSGLEGFRLKKIKEKEFLGFLQRNSFKLRMTIPNVGQVRETIDFLGDNIPSWETETSADEFAKLILVRYPDLKNSWESLSAEVDDVASSDWDDDPATERQLDYLRDLGATVSPDISKGEASELIDHLCHQASDAQKRRLNFYRLDFDPHITKDQASTLIDRYRTRHPESEDAYQKWKIQHHIL
jgi:GYF domain 2